MNDKDKAILNEMNQQPKGFGKADNNNSTKDKENQPRKSIADSMNLNATEQKLVELTSDLKSTQMLRLVETETLRKFGLGIQESTGLISNLVNKLEDLSSYDFSFNADDAEFLLSGQPLTTNLLESAR
jgi:hypothetical protein